MNAIFKREFRSYFTSPLGYMALGILFFFAGYSFSLSNLHGGFSDLTGVFGNLLIIVMWVILPVLTMRTFSDEKRQKTDQAILTAPVRLTGIVAAKFLAVMLVFTLALSITLLLGVIIAFTVTPDWMVIIGSFLGMLMLGGLIASIGLLFSSLTESQFIAALATFGISFLWLMLDQLKAYITSMAWLDKIIAFLSIYERFAYFTSGIIRYDSVVFFLSLQGLFLFLTVRVLDSRRWS